MSLRLIPITGIDADLQDIEPLYLNKSLTKWIRDGRPWDRNRIRRYLSYFEEENVRETKFIDFKIILDTDLKTVTIGIVVFRSYFYLAGNEYQGKPFITILIDPNYQGKGYGTYILPESISQYQSFFPSEDDIYSFIREDNLPSYRLHLHAGFIPIKEVLSHNNRYQLMAFTTSSKSIDPQGNKREIISSLTNRILSGELEFPYVKTFLPSPEEIMTRYQTSEVKFSTDPYFNICGYRSDDKLFLPPSIQFDGSTSYIQIISNHFPDYEKINALTDIFTEDQRIQSKKIYSKMSTAQCWMDKNCVKQIVTRLVNTFPSYENDNLRESTYMISKDPGLFKLMWIRGILLMLVQDQIPSGTCRFLDISAGWCDRLIGAIAHNCDYLGFDPNINLKKGHDEIIDKFGNPQRHKVIYPVSYTHLRAHETVLDL